MHTIKATHSRTEIVTCRHPGSFQILLVHLQIGLDTRIIKRARLGSVFAHSHKDRSLTILSFIIVHLG